VSVGKTPSPEDVEFGGRKGVAGFGGVREFCQKPNPLKGWHPKKGTPEPDVRRNITVSLSGEGDAEIH